MSVTASAQTRAVLRRGPLEYPPLAARMRLTGKVMVAASIDAEGNVTEVHAISGHPLLRPAAEKAVLQWKFAGGVKPSDTNIEIQFQLDAASAR